MQCFEICLDDPPMCFRLCIPEYIMLPHFPPEPPETITIDGVHPEWLRDVHALVMTANAAEMATGETAKILNDAVTRSSALVQKRMPTGMTLKQHQHERKKA